jgi:hypothetical protein
VPGAAPAHTAHDDRAGLLNGCGLYFYAERSGLAGAWSPPEYGCGLYLEPARIVETLVRTLLGLPDPFAGKTDGGGVSKCEIV